MILTIANASVPQALIPVASVVEVLGVDSFQVHAWCSTGKLRAVKHLGHWWVAVDDLTDFVERSSWQFVAPPVDNPVPIRRASRRKSPPA
jgi:hypothetical protein